MADTKETAVKKRIKALLEDVHVNTPATAGFGKSGQLDFVCCIDGVYVAIEAKSIHSPYGKDGPTQLQWDEIDSIVANGGIALCIDESNMDTLRKFLHEMQHGRTDVARFLASITLTRFERPKLDPETDTKPTKRTRHV
jgi:hypothetical protein